MEKKVLIVTDSREPNVTKVLSFLESLSQSVIRFNTDELLEGFKFNFSIFNGRSEWWIEKGWRINSDEIKSVWYRRPPSPKVPAGVDSLYHDFVENEANKFLWSLWTSFDLRHVFWMNHPMSLKLLEFNKPYQLQMAGRVGLKTPETIITTDPEVALNFSDRWNNEIVVKIFSGSVLRDAEGNLLSIFTNRVSREQIKEYFDGISCVPVMLQNYIPKQIELRITVVGNSVFACAIHSQDSLRTKDDWRHYDFENVKHEIYQLPFDIQEKILKLMRAFNISFGAIDMILTPTGEYVFLEVNPSGQWGWIERLTKMPISKSIADLLATPPLK